MAKELALLCDVQRLFPHQDDAAQSLVLGLTLQLAFSEGFDDTNDKDVAWTELWNWQAVSAVDLWFFDATEPAAAPQPLLANVPIWPPPGVPAPAEAKQALHRRLRQLYDDGKASAFAWNVDNPSAPLPAEGHVLQVQAAAARLATSPGYALNLCVAVKVANTQIPYAGHVLPKGALVMAVPRMRWQTAGAAPSDVTFTPVAGGPKRPAAREMVDWHYDKTVAAGDPAVIPGLTAYAAPFDLETHDSPGRFVQLGTGWVQRGVGGVNLEVGEDWLRKLADRVAENWDLARHLIDAVSGLVAIPDVPLYRQLIVAALRDRAGLGLIDTTDGAGLLRYAIELAVPVAPPGQLPSTNQALIRDGQLRSLQAKMRFAERSGSAVTLSGWWNALRAAMPADLNAALNSNLPDILNNPQPAQLLTVTWPRPPAGQADPVWPLLSGAAPALTLRVYGTRDETDPAQALVTLPGITGIRIAQVDGRCSITFDEFSQSKPLPAGWLEVVLADVVPPPPAPPANLFPSERVSVSSGVSSALALLSRVWNELRRAPTLAGIISAKWDELAKGSFSVPHHTTTLPWFTTVWTTVANDANYTVTSDEVGEMKPLDGRTWTVSLRQIEHSAAGAAAWVDGASYVLDFANAYDPTGAPTAGASRVVLKVQLGTVAGQHQLQLTLSWITAAGATDIATTTINVSGNGYDLRVEVSGSTDRKLNVRTFVGEKTTVGGVAKMAWSAGPGGAIADPNFERVGLQLLNPQGAVDHDMSAFAPSLLSLPTRLDDLPELRDAWYQEGNLDPGPMLWAQVSGATSALLPKLNLQRVLALGQTARLMPIWHHQLRIDDFDYAGYLQRTFSEQLQSLFAARCDIPPGTQKSSVYRDFQPRVAPVNLSADVIAIVQQYLTKVASRVSLIAAAQVGEFVEQPSDRNRTPTPHPLCLQVDRAAMFPETQAAGQDSDLLRILSGFGAMIQQAGRSPVVAPGVSDYFGNQPWELLNCVDVGVLKDPLPTSTQPPPLYDYYQVPTAYERLVAAVPLQYAGQERQVTITYRSHHLVALSPLADIADVCDFGNRQVDKTGTHAPDLKTSLPPFLHRIPTVATAGYDWGILPTLKFGQFYRLLLFCLGNCGNMPRLLTGGKSEHPAQLRTTAISDAEFAAEDAQLHIRQQFYNIIYLRRVGVGLPRLEHNGWPNPPSLKRPDTPLVPPVPPDVRPLATEWGILGLTSTCPVLRFNYDESARTGDISNTSNWALIVPRVTVAGSSDDDTQAATQFDLRFGLSVFSIGGRQRCGVRVLRNGSDLTVGIDGAAPSTRQLVHPEAGLISSGPLDFRLAYAGGSCYLAWRRSDRDEAWLPWNGPEEVVGPAAAVSSQAWVEIERDTPTGAREFVVTCGTPDFASGSVLLTDQLPKKVLDDAMGLARLSTPSCSIAVLKHDDQGFDFNLRPPSVDLETWDAWTEMDRDPTTPAGQAAATLRRAVWYRHKYWTAPQDKRTPRFDGSLDDPAVEKLLVELAPLRSDSPQKVSREIWDLSKAANTVGIDPIAGDPQNPFAPQNPLNAVQHLPAAFAVRAVTVWGAAPPPVRLVQSPGNKFQVTLQEQELWELRVYPMVRESFFDPTNPQPGKQRFHSDFCEGAEFETGGTKYRLFNPWRMTLEVATPEVVQYPLAAAEADFRRAVLALPQDKRPAELAKSRLYRQSTLLAALHGEFDGQTVRAQPFPAKRDAMWLQEGRGERRYVG